MIEFRDTSDVELVQSMGGDDMVVAAARASRSGELSLRDRGAAPEAECFGLINYLMKHRHGTPFEHAALTLFVKAPVMVWWEWVRHRIGHSYNLESGRYKVLDPIFWIPPVGRKMRKAADHKSAQPHFEPDEELRRFAAEALMESHEFAYNKYMEMIDRGVPNEVARAALPFGVYYAGWVTVNPRSLMAFLSLRTHDPEAKFVSYPQAEIEGAARIAEDIFAAGWPITHRAFVANGRMGP